MTSEVRQRDIFRQGNITCYVSGKFFPRVYRSDLYRLYGFAMTVDRFVDSGPSQAKQLRDLRRGWETAKEDPNFDVIPAQNDSVVERAVKNIVKLTNLYELDPQWVDTYLEAQERDLNGRTYKTLDDTLDQISNTSEILALMMCKIIRLDPITYSAARLEARAIQYTNFVRDIAMYNRLGKCYIPEDEIKKFGLSDLSAESARENKEAFTKCIQTQLNRCTKWQSLAREDIYYLPQNCKVSLLTMMDMYDWLAATISHNPLIIYDHQVMPTKRRVLAAGLANMLVV